MTIYHATSPESPPVPKLISDILEKLHKEAKTQLVQRGELVPFLFGFSPQENGEMKVYSYNVSTLMNSSKNKEIVRMMMEEAIEQDDIVVTMLISEAWLLKLPADDLAKKNVLNLRPSEHPSKQEVVLVNIMTKTNQLMAHAKIYRDPVNLSGFEIVSLNGEGEGTLVRDVEDTPRIH